MDNMDDFDAAMSYWADPTRAGLFPAPGYLQPLPTELDSHEPASDVSEQPLVNPYGLSLPASDDLDQSSLRPDSNSNDEPSPTTNASNPKPPSHEATLDKKDRLLSFASPVHNFILLDYSLRRTWLKMSAQLHGMFFLAESQRSGASEEAPPPPELTCYRRNLFQITGEVTVPKALRYIMTEQGDRIPILAQDLTVSATESIEGNAVKIISVPWKSSTAEGTSAADDKTEKEPSSITVDALSGSDLDADHALVPVQWKRLQFRIATANNGRRKELQQHFVISLKIIATLSTGARICIAEARSGAIIVRGRSPRNFQSRNDLPLSSSAVNARKHAGNGHSKSSQRSQVQSNRPSDEGLPIACSGAGAPQPLSATTSVPDKEIWTPMPPDWRQDPASITDFVDPIMSSQIPTGPDPEPVDLVPMTGRANSYFAVLADPMNLALSSEDERNSFARQLSPPKAPTSNPSQKMQIDGDGATLSPVGRMAASPPSTSDPRCRRQPSRRTPPAELPSAHATKRRRKRPTSQSISTGPSTSVSLSHSPATPRTAEFPPCSAPRDSGGPNEDIAARTMPDHDPTTAASAPPLSKTDARTNHDDYDDDDDTDDSDEIDMARYEYVPLYLDDWLAPASGLSGRDEWPDHQHFFQRAKTDIGRAGFPWSPDLAGHEHELPTLWAGYLGDPGGPCRSRKRGFCC